MQYKFYHIHRTTSVFDIHDTSGSYVQMTGMLRSKYALLRFNNATYLR